MLHAPRLSHRTPQYSLQTIIDCIKTGDPFLDLREDDIIIVLHRDNLGWLQFGYYSLSHLSHVMQPLQNVGCCQFVTGH